MSTPRKMPGVYVEESSSFPSSIVANATAVPVFIGFTEKAVQDNGKSLPVIKGSDCVSEPVLVKSVLGYELAFGGPDTTGTIELTDDQEGQGPYTATISKNDKPYTPGLIYPSVSNYFANGGGSCYVVSIGSYADFDANDTDSVDMEYILKAIEMAEQCTLILPTDLIRYGTDHYYDWCNAFINYSEETKEQFCVLDVIMKDPGSPVMDFQDVETYRESVTSDYLKYAAAYYPYLKSLTAYAYDIDRVTLNGSSITTMDLETGKVENNVDNATLEAIKTFLSTFYIHMPPSPFMAGIYSRLDNATGVWTPPANTSPAGVTGPVVNLTNQQQEVFNVDTTGGKSINAIRSFTGKGTLVWGARTNDGNSMDWRYVNVVRLFISMETDIGMALEAFVFKANVHNTWVEVKTMIESYLYGLHAQGAFAGTTAESSYQVLIGLGETMTDEDVLNGYMRVSIMVAPVRPAEFIVLTFSQLVGQ